MVLLYVSTAGSPGRAEAARGNTPVYTSVILCITYCVFTPLEGSESCVTGWFGQEGPLMPLNGVGRTVKKICISALES